MGSTASGATWSPVWISYGYNNRTQMLRIRGRVGSRTGRSTVPATYLAAAAVLAAGMDGIENGLDAGEPNAENLYTIPEASCARAGSRRCLRTCWRRSVELEHDDVLRSALGRGRDEDYVDYFAREAGRVVPLPRAGHSVGDP